MSTNGAGEGTGPGRTRSSFGLPLVVAVTGHRDLVQEEVPAIRERVRELFVDLSQRAGERNLRVMSPLAEGADRLVAEEALALGLELIVPLPMPRELYALDFKDEASAREFDRLATRAAELYELPLAAGVTQDQLHSARDARARQYAQQAAMAEDRDAWLAIAERWERLAEEEEAKTKKGD